MKRYALCLSFLILASNPSFGLSWGSLLWLGGQQTEVEKPEVVEVVRWRQPVCMLPAAGVQSCLSGLSDLQKEYERVNEKEFEEEQNKFDEFIKDKESKIYGDVLSMDNSDVRSMYELFEQLRPSEEDHDLDDDRRKVKRTTPLDERIVRGNNRDAKYFSASNDKPNLIYVTKVLTAPVTATLIAHHCIPEVGIPLCEDDDSLENVRLFEDVSKEEKVDKTKLLDMIAKHQSVVDVIHRMMKKPGESETEKKYHDDVESSEKSNVNFVEDSKKLQGLEPTEMLLENDQNSDNFNRKKRHIDFALLDKLQYLFHKQKDTAFVVDNVPQHPLWVMLQKHYGDIIQHIQDKKTFPIYNEPVPLTNEGSSSKKPTHLDDSTTTTAVANP